MQKVITLSLSEFEKLERENKELKEFVENKDLIAIEVRCENMGMGWIRNSWNIATKQEAIIELTKAIKDLEFKEYNLHSQVMELRFKLEQKESRKWFKFF
jgi:hypothetical protein